jgi:peptidoglycan hydrolase-like protein with peptidoglycan-binding domain
VGDLTPDQVIANVQKALQADAIYTGPINGVLDSATRNAIEKFQTENGLSAVGAIDKPTIEALGLAGPSNNALNVSN